MTAKQIAIYVRALDSIAGGDPEGDHAEADDILLEVVPEEIRKAYEQLVARAKWWAFA